MLVGLIGSLQARCGLVVGWDGWLLVLGGLALVLGHLLLVVVPLALVIVALLLVMAALAMLIVALLLVMVALASLIVTLLLDLCSSHLSALCCELQVWTPQVLTPKAWRVQPPIPIPARGQHCAADSWFRGRWPLFFTPFRPLFPPEGLGLR